MPYHVSEENINSVDISASIKACNKGIYKTFEQAADVVVSKLIYEKNLLDGAIRHIGAMLPLDAELCSCKYEKEL